MAKEENVTEEQAQEALHQLAFSTDDAETGVVEQSPPAEEQPTEPKETQKVGTEDTQEVQPEIDASEETQEEEKTSESDVEALGKQYQERMEALKLRNAENERILRERYLRKATSTDKALKILKATRTNEGVSEADVDRVISEIEGTMHPESASYVPPAEQSEGTESQSLILNNFLNEKGMTVDEAQDFGTWIRSEAPKEMSEAEQAVARQSIDGFLRLAHARWQDSTSASAKETKRNDVVGAVKSVQRTQRQAARAASVSPAAPKKQPASPKTGVDVSKLTKTDVANLLRQSVDQYR